MMVEFSTQKRKGRHHGQAKQQGVLPVQRSVRNRGRMNKTHDFRARPQGARRSGAEAAAVTG
jgi:hypothetical protein